MYLCIYLETSLTCGCDTPSTVVLNVGFPVFKIDNSTYIL